MFHLCWSRKSFSFRPREASSAGLDLLLTYFHWLGSVLFLIVWTWFATKTWKRFWLLPMYLKTVISDGSSMVNSFVISMFQTRTDVAAAVSSRRGMVVILTRASLAFPIRNGVMGLAFVVNQSQVWHLTVACGASISEVMDLPWDHPAEVLRLEASSHAKLFQHWSQGSSRFQFSQRARYSSEIFSSQPNFSLQRFWRIFFPINRNGAAMPKGS